MLVVNALAQAHPQTYQQILVGIAQRWRECLDCVWVYHKVGSSTLLPQAYFPASPSKSPPASYTYIQITSQWAQRCNFFLFNQLIQSFKTTLEKISKQTVLKGWSINPRAIYRPYNLRHFGHQRSTLLLKHIPSKRLNARLSRIWKLTTYAASHCYIQHGAVPRRLIPVQ